MSCNCKVCQFAKQVDGAMAGTYDEMRDMIAELYLRLVHAEMDRDVAESVIDGSWPSAAEVIRYARRRQRKKSPASP